MSDAEDAAAAFQPYLERYLAQVPGGPEGDLEMRKKIDTPFMDVTADTLRLDSLSDEQIDGWQTYAAWELWELIANRQTEGQSGLIPRQEYETCSFVQQWATYPDLFRQIIDKIGVDGVVELGRVSRREVGTKLNVTRNWAVQMCTLIGRGIAVKMGLEGPTARREDLETVIQFGRRMQYGTWGEGCGFVSGRGFKSPTLDDDVLAPLLVAAEPLADDELRKAFRRFNGATEVLGFLLHYDCRAGMADTGPYPLPDGSGFALVRDHILYEPAYPWAEVASDLPYAITEVLVFKPGDDPLQVKINDISTTFTVPTNYHRYLHSVAVFARDERTSPMDSLRALGPGEMLSIAKRCSKITLDAYSTIAGKSREEKIRDGVKVYTYEMMMPMAQAAGLWDDMLANGFDELSPLAEEAWPTLTSGAAETILPPVFLLGEGFPLLGTGGAESAASAVAEAG
jgi:hypothetical protein